MRYSLIRSVSRRNLAKHGLLTIRLNSVSALAFSDLSDSGSDENCSFLNINNIAYSFHHHTRQVFDKKYAVIDTLDYLKRKHKTGLYFISHLKVCGFKHDILTYMAIIRFFCYWRMVRRLEYLFLEVIEDRIGAFSFGVSDLFEELLKHVNVDGDNSFVLAVDGLIKAYISTGQFDEVFAVLREIQGGFLPSVVSCNLLMNRLVEEGEVDKAIAVYKHLKMNGFSSNVYTYGIVVKGLCRKGCVNEAADVFREMVDGGVEPNAFIHGSYIDGLCSNGYIDTAYVLLKMLRESDSPIDVFAYGSVIRGFIKELRLQDAENVLLDMKQAAIVPDANCYGALIQGYIQERNVLKALDLHHEMCAKGITTNLVILSSIMHGLCHSGMLPEAVDLFRNAINSGMFLDEVAYNIAIDAQCRLGKMHEAMMLLEEMKNKKLKPNVKHYTTLIKGCCIHRDIWNALNIFGEMLKRGLKPNTIITFNVLVGGFSECGLVQETMNLLDDMLALGLKPTNVTNNIVIEGLCKGRKVEEAELFFNKLERKSSGNYVAMMNGYHETNNMERLYELFHRLSEQGKEGIFVAKSSCCLKLLSWLCEEDKTNKALILFKTILQSNNGPSKIMYSKLQSAYCRAGDMRKARWVFDTMVERGAIPDVISYTIMLNGYLRNDFLIEARDLLDDMLKHGIQPDKITYTVLFDWESRVKWKTLNITNWRSMEQETLSRYLTVMQEFVPDVACYTVLINHYCKIHDLETARCLLNEMYDHCIKPDRVAYTSLIRGYRSWGFEEEANSLFDRMVSEGIQPDARTFEALEMVRG